MYFVKIPWKFKFHRSKIDRRKIKCSFWIIYHIRWVSPNASTKWLIKIPIRKFIQTLIYFSLLFLACCFPIWLDYSRLIERWCCHCSRGPNQSVELRSVHNYSHQWIGSGYKQRLRRSLNRWQCGNWISVLQLFFFWKYFMGIWILGGGSYCRNDWLVSRERLCTLKPATSGFAVNEWMIYGRNEDFLRRR